MWGNCVQAQPYRYTIKIHLKHHTTPRAQQMDVICLQKITCISFSQWGVLLQMHGHPCVHKVDSYECTCYISYLCTSATDSQKPSHRVQDCALQRETALSFTLEKDESYMRATTRHDWYNNDPLFSVQAIMFRSEPSDRVGTRHKNGYHAPHLMFTSFNHPPWFAYIYVSCVGDSKNHQIRDTCWIPPRLHLFCLRPILSTLPLLTWWND